MKKKLIGLAVTVYAVAFQVQVIAQYDYNYFVENSVVLNNPTVYSCANVGFESSDFSDWHAFYGSNNYGFTGLSDGITTLSHAASLPSAITTNPYGIVNNKLFEHITSETMSSYAAPYSDPYINNMIHDGNGSLRLGAPSSTNFKCIIKQRLKVNSSNAVFKFNYAVVAIYHAAHKYNGQSYFRFYLEDEAYNIIPCTEIREVAGNMTGSVNAGTLGGDQVQVKNWTTHTINLFDYVDLDDEITIVFEVASCSGAGHFAYAYLDGICTSGAISTPASGGDHCMEGSVNFSHPLVNTLPTGSYLWSFYDNDEGTGTPVTSNAPSPSMTYDTPGDYLVTLTVNSPISGCPGQEYDQIISIIQCCDTCVSFEPTPGVYWFSAWVSVDYLAQQKTFNEGADGAYASLSFIGGTPGTVEFYPVGAIIDGWQRIAGKFTIPNGTAELGVGLYAHDDYDSYFDDIRIHPFNASMKSYVYDGKTFWLVAELDDNNYATFYEYDEEGGLVRIKKETSRGVVTIQETRSNTVKTTTP